MRSTTEVCYELIILHFLFINNPETDLPVDKVEIYQMSRYILKIKTGDYSISKLIVKNETATLTNLLLPTCRQHLRLTVTPINLLIFESSSSFTSLLFYISVNSQKRTCINHVYFYEIEFLYIRTYTLMCNFRVFIAFQRHRAEQ